MQRNQACSKVKDIQIPWAERYTYLLSSLHRNSRVLGRSSSQAVELVEEIGRRSAMETDDPNETMYLFQRISVAIQKGNALSFTYTFDIGSTQSATAVITISPLHINFLAWGFVLAGAKKKIIIIINIIIIL